MLTLTVTGLLLATAPAPPSRDVVAVFDIVAGGGSGLTESATPKFTRLVQDVVIQAGYRTVPLNQIRAHLRASQAESFRACYDEACQIELGKAVAATKALSATWDQVDERCVLSVKLYDLQSELAEFSSTPDAACTEAGLKSAIEALGAALKSRLGGYGTFKLDLAESAKIKNPPTDQSGYLAIAAEARGRPHETIDVFINGQPSGVVSRDRLFVKQLAVGRYVILLRTTGDRFAHVRLEIVMTPDKVRIPKTGLLQLEPVFGQLLVEGSPARATLVIDGRPKTIDSPHSHELRAGIHRVVVEAPGHLPFESDVDVQPGRDSRLAYVLVRNAGKLHVAGAPTGAAVLVDGNRVGALPLVDFEVDVGDHVIEVNAPGHHPAKQIVAIGLGSRAQIDVALTRKIARLRVEATASVLGEAVPVEADVYVDGHRVGTTPWKADVLADVSLRLELRLGDHRSDERVVSLPEGREQREVIGVPASWGGAVSTLRFDLVDGPWKVRSGAAELDPGAPNPVRPGRQPLDLFLDETKVGSLTVTVSPSDERTVVVIQRPRTDAELSAASSAWTWRRWVSLGLAVGASAVAGERLLASEAAAADRDQALVAMRGATTATELDALRTTVIEREDARLSGRTIGLGAVVTAGALAVWTVVEWFFAEPTRGRLVLADSEHLITTEDESAGRTSP